MAVWNVGSFSEQILNLVDDIPAGISGALNDIVERKIANPVEEYTGASIGTEGIEAKYQGPILNFALADVLSAMEIQGVDADNIKLGDLSIKKGGGSNLTSSAKAYEAQGMQQLKNLGKNYRFGKANG